jgi:hypothetical protein
MPPMYETSLSNEAWEAIKPFFYQIHHAADLVLMSFATYWTGSYILLKMDALGDVYHMIFHHGERSIITFVSGQFLAYGNF